jgi:hypothetical protein
MTKETVYCPISERQVTGDECYDVAMVAEGFTPERFLPEDVKPERVKKMNLICLSCKYHPK